MQNHSRHRLPADEPGRHRITLRHATSFQTRLFQGPDVLVSLTLTCLGRAPLQATAIRLGNVPRDFKQETVFTYEVEGSRVEVTYLILTEEAFLKKYQCQMPESPSLPRQTFVIGKETVRGVVALFLLGFFAGRVPVELEVGLAWPSLASSEPQLT